MTQLFYISPALSNCLVLCVLLCSVSCADYERGYEHGYNDIEARSWLVRGREEYDRGYEQGRMQAFQDDWYAENAGDMVVGLSCTAPLVRSNLALFTKQNVLIEFN